MAINRFKPHVFVIPEDRADEQLADGFIEHHRINSKNIQVMPPAGGWQSVLNQFKTEYVKWLNNYHDGHVVLLIDFDEAVDIRRSLFEESIPEELKPRVFVIGARNEPETLRKLLGRTLTLAQIGNHLAEECTSGQFDIWLNDELQHNTDERGRLADAVQKFCVS